MRYLDTAPDNPRLRGKHYKPPVGPKLTECIDISAATSMTIEDIYTTLTQQKMILARETTPPPVRPSPGQSIKFPRGRRHGVARRHLQRTQTKDDVETPVAVLFRPPTQYVIRWDRERVTQYLAAWESKGYLQLKPEKLKWSPFLLARMTKSDVVDMDAADLTAEVDLVSGSGTPNPPYNGSATPISSVENTFHDEVRVTPSGDDDFKPEEDDEPHLPVFASLEITDNHRSVTSEQPESSLPQRRPRGRPKRPKASNSLNGHSSPAHGLTGGHRTRSDAVLMLKTGEQSLAGDEALAAKLALEEQRSSRSLRTRPSSISVTRSSSPKKRRKVDSSLETDVPPGATSAPNGTLVQHLNGSGSHQPHQFSNGLGGNSNPIPLPRLSTHLERRTSFQAATVTSKPLIPIRVDVKSEPPTTPLSGLTNHHNLPSDGSVPATKGTQQAVDVPRTDLGNATRETTDVSIGACEVVDADANCEADADAEGEDDLDADGDIDAEGELDVGETDGEIAF